MNQRLTYTLPQLTPLKVPPLSRMSKLKVPKRVYTNQAIRVLVYLILFLVIGFFFSPQHHPSSDDQLDRAQHQIPIKLFHPSGPHEEPSKSQPRSSRFSRFHRERVEKSTPTSVKMSDTKESEIVRRDYLKVITDFMDTADLIAYNESKLIHQFESDENNVQRTCMLVTIKDGVAKFKDDFKGTRHGRSASVHYIINKIITKRALNGQPPLPDVVFPVMVTDGHGVRVATFGSARHWRNWNKFTPVPMGNSRGMDQGWGTELKGWDNYMKTKITDSHVNYSWSSKIEKANFRGALSMQKHRLGSCNWQNHHQCALARDWKDCTRGVLHLRTKDNPELFDVGFTALKAKSDAPKDVFDGAPSVVENMPFIDGQKYKYIINVGNNQDWAERMRVLLFSNSAIVMHEAETQEFFTPLLKPWVHYIPTNLMMTDIVENVKWAKDHDDKVKKIVQKANDFAHRYISEEAMYIYWELVIKEYARRQNKSRNITSSS